MKIFKRLLSNIDELVCGAALVLMICLVIINVFCRYVFSYSISWAEEVSTICFVWCVFMGASATYKHNLDMGIDYIVAKLPHKYRQLMTIATRCILLVITGYIFMMAVVFTRIAWIKPTAVLGVSSAVFNSALVAGFGLITMYTLRFLVRDVLMFKQSLKSDPAS